jgi:hypothetical protein
MSKIIAKLVRTSAMAVVAGVFLSATAMAVTPCLGGFPAGCCLGDCSGDGTVTAGELTKIIAIVLNCNRMAAGCPAVAGGSGCVNADKNGDGTITAGEFNNIIFNVLNFPAQNGCPAPATPTSTSTSLVPPTPTNTPIPTATATPTQTTPPTPTATSMVAAVCGNGMVEGDEQCDDGGFCVGGSTSDPTYAQPCPPNVPSGVTCAGGNTCIKFGGHGCAMNCTVETTVHFVFTGAKCVGGAKNGQDCKFIETCSAGTLPGGSAVGKPCGSDSDCGTGGTCTSECATGSDGGDCFGVGICTAGDAGKVGVTECPSSSAEASVNVCQGGTKPGIACTADADCGTGGSCVNPCGTNGTCGHQSGANLTAIGALVQGLPVGPLIGSEDLQVGQAGADGLVPITVPAASVHFEDVKVPGLACACPHGVPEPDVHGPGNSGSGFVGCSASGLSGVNVAVTIDHDTKPGDTGNGPGTCMTGTRLGLACGGPSDCPPGNGTCSGKGGGGGMCVGGTNAGKVCHANTDCPGSICNSPDDATCTAQDPEPPLGSGSKACLEQRVICTSGPNAGQACTTSSQCGTGGTCGATCNANSVHAGSAMCNSPTHLTISGSGPEGSALVVTTTAIGTIALPDDLGTCSLSAYCLPFNVGTTPVACTVNNDCTAGHTCNPAFCAGKCIGGTGTGKSCTKTTDCPGTGAICSGGSNFAKPCTQATASADCGSTNICVPVSAAKGFDGLPCTADDASTSMGTPQTLPTTTGIASSSVVDAYDGSTLGKLITDGACTNPLSSCITTFTGHPVACQAGTPQVIVHGASLATAFPSLDQTQIFDDVVTSHFTAK